MYSELYISLIISQSILTFKGTHCTCKTRLTSSEGWLF